MTRDSFHVSTTRSLGSTTSESRLNGVNCFLIPSIVGLECSSECRGWAHVQVAPWKQRGEKKKKTIPVQCVSTKCQTKARLKKKNENYSLSCWCRKPQTSLWYFTSLNRTVDTWDLLRQKKKLQWEIWSFCTLSSTISFWEASVDEKKMRRAVSPGVWNVGISSICAANRRSSKRPLTDLRKTLSSSCFFFFRPFFFFLSIFLIYTSRGRSAVRWSGEAWLASSRRVTHVLGLFALQRFLPSGNAARRVFLSFQMTFKPPVGFLYLPRPYVSN